MNIELKKLWHTENIRMAIFFMHRAEKLLRGTKKARYEPNDEEDIEHAIHHLKFVQGFLRSSVDSSDDEDEDREQDTKNKRKKVQNKTEEKDSNLTSEKHRKEPVGMLTTSNKDETDDDEYVESSQ